MSSSTDQRINGLRLWGPRDDVVFVATNMVSLLSGVRGAGWNEGRGQFHWTAKPPLQKYMDQSESFLYFSHFYRVTYYDSFCLT